MSTPRQGVDALWAKSPGDGEQPLALTTHLADACEVASVYWHAFVSPRMRTEIIERLDGDASRAERLVRWLAAAHDTGKATPSFAGQVPALRDGVERGGLPLLNDPRANSELRHDLAGGALWFERLRDLGWPDAIAQQYALVIAGHHGTYPTKHDWCNAIQNRHHTGRRHEAWRNTQAALMDRVVRIAGLEADDLEVFSRTPLPVPLQLQLVGLVIHSDWIASDASRFPLGRADAPGVPDTRDSHERAAAAWEDLALPGPWHPRLDDADEAAVYRDRFGWPEQFGPRPVQRRALEIARSVSPGLMVIEAPMGVGKTEAAFAVVENWGARTGCSGVYMALPTMATSDAMLGRALAWSERVPGTGTTSVFLAHSKRQFNGDFAALPRTRALRTGTGNAAAVDPSSRGAVNAEHEQHASVAAWLTGKRRGIAANIVVGTVDHVLMLALRRRYGALQHSALAGKVVVIDEVHASDARMLFFLNRALEWLAAYGVPVVLLSATLTSSIREQLVQSYESGVRARNVSETVAEPTSATDARCSDDADATAAPATTDAQPPRARRKRIRTRGLDAAASAAEKPVAAAPQQPEAAPVIYPLITVVDGDGRRQQVAPGAEGAARSEVRLETIGDDVDDLLELLRDRTRDGGCVLIVRNTVRRATELFDAIRADPDLGGDVVLSHSRFIGPHRAENDAALVERFGPPSSRRVRPGIERPAIVVATQVAEMSLDCDFDLLITDLAPVDAILQRIGRLHRHTRDARPPALAHPSCIITGVDDWAAEPIVPNRGSATVYGLSALLRSALVLRPYVEAGGRALQLPDEIGQLVEAAGSERFDAPEAWADALAEADLKAREKRDESEQRARSWRIAGVAETKSLLGFTHQALDDRDEQVGLATVRDGEDTFEVILVRHHDQPGMLKTMQTTEDPEGREIPTEMTPDPDIARIAAAAAVRLPAHLCVGATGDAIIAELEETNYHPAWEQSPFLRGQLVVELDDDNSARLTGHHLHYDRERGLEVTRVERT